MYFPYVFLFGCGAGFEINAAATAAYVDAQCDICTEEILGTLAMDCDCDSLFWDGDVPPNPVTYNTPATDPAIWWNPAIPESARFLGYRVRNVERPNQVSRPVTQRLGRSGGGVLGALNRTATRFNFQVLLFACDEPGMEYGYRFLSNTLACFQLDSQCDRALLVYRDTCPELSGSPTLAEVSQGQWLLSDALLVSGPTWANDPISGMRKYVRQVDFSIAGEFVEPVPA